MAATNLQSADDAPNSPWNRTVRDSEVVPTPAVTEENVSSPDDSGTDDVSKKPVWNTPSNGGGGGGGVDAAPFNPVMGAAWPALGESTKPTLKSSDSLADASLSPALQVTGTSSPSNKQAAAANVNPTSTPNHVAPSKHKSFKRGGGNSSPNVSAKGAVSQPPTTQDLVVEPPHNVNVTGKAGNDHRDSQKGAQSHGGNDHHPQQQQHNNQRGGYKRGNSRSFNNRDHDRGNQEWNQRSRSFNNRDTHLQSQRGFPRGGGYIRPAVHTSASLIPPQMHVPMQPFGNNMLYPDVTSSLVYFGPPPPPMPFGAPLSPVYFGHDPLLNANIVSQIDYYFSNENLVKDTYLRRNMDEQGWVSASLIAGFKKVSLLTDNVQLILDVMRSSAVVEVQGDKIRRQNDWMKWIMPAPGQYLNPSSPQANHEGLVSQVQSLTLHGQVETQFSRSSSEGEGTVGVTGQQAGFDHASAA
ncbi:la-related protein 1C-like [Bidens hawaiensis]|uniref:la-related protein 1C-like n=1 Tax=Bidens hawaiensis TaxID=980011 RepID=UPI004049E2CE